MPQNNKKKSPKGTVSVEEFQNRLRLRWRFQGKRYALSIGLPDSKINRQVAQQKATIIELDIASGNFDATLKKYKPHTQNGQVLSITNLFEHFVEYKTKRILSRSLEKYYATLGYLERYFENQTVAAIDEKAAERFTDWLTKQKLSPTVCRERLRLIRAAWDWGVTNDYVELKEPNPWVDEILRVRVSPKQMPKPFSREEITAIVEGFRSNRYYKYYADYVDFLFGTGCRTAEAIGLCWKHITDDCSSIWIGESLTRGVRKSTKTNRARTIGLSAKLQRMLLARRTENPEPEGLVFRAARGGAIDDHNFRNRAWTTILNELGINYRKPYNTRHTFISHALNMGMNPVEVAQLTGHDVQTLYENYAGSVNSRPRLPEL